jgi:hypothetical protein
VAILPGYLIILASFNSSAQSALTNEGILQVSNGTILSVNGSYVHGSDIADLGIDDNGLLMLTGSIINLSASAVTNGLTGKIELNGTSQQLIDRSSGNAILFYDLTINNPSGFLLNGGIQVAHDLLMQQGTGDLDTSKLELISMAQLLSETNINRITAGTGSLKTDARFFASEELDNPTNIAGLGMEISIPSFGGGLVQIERTHLAQPANENSESILRTFEILVTDGSMPLTAQGDIRFHYFDAELGAIAPEEMNFTLFQSTDNGTTWLNRGGIVITSGNYVDLTGVNDLNGLWTVSYCVAPSVSLGDDLSICPESGTTLAAVTGSGTFTYQWYGDNVLIGGETSETLLAGIQDEMVLYAVVVTNEFGCTASDELTISPRTLPVVDLGADFTVCANEAVMLDAGSGFAVYLWKNAAGDELASTQTLLVTDADEYAVTVTDEFGCQNSDSVIVDHYALPESNLSIISSTCGDSILLGTGLEDLNPGASFEWRDEQGNLLGADAEIVIGTDGTYYVTITNTDNCSITASTEVILNSTDLVNLGEDFTVCAESNINFDATRTNSSYLWSTGETTSSITFTTSVQDEWVWVEITDLVSDCTARDSVYVSVNPLPVLSIEAVANICPGETAILDAGEGFMSYLWSEGSATQTIEVMDEGIYDITVTNEFGCENTASVELVFNELPVSNLAEVTATCGDELVVGAGLSELNPGASFEWSSGEVTPEIQVTQEGLYSVLITGANGCTLTDVTEVFLNETDFVDLGPDIELECEEITIDAGNPGSTYVWSDGSTDRFLVTDQPGTYSVTVTTPFGCVDMDETSVILLPPVDSAFFLAATEAFVMDTIYFVGLTTALTTSIDWNFGDGTMVNGNETLANHQYATANLYNASMTTVFDNGCIDTYSKQITITEIEGEGESGGRIAQRLIEEVTIYPNPNEGRFSIDIRLSSTAPIAISIVNMGGLPIGTHTADGAASYNLPYDLTGTVPGIYVLSVSAGNEIRRYRVLITR